MPIADTLFGPVEPKQDGAEILAALQAAARGRILILDGAMGTQIQGLGFDEDHFRGDRFVGCACHQQGNNDLLILSQPRAIEDIHYQYAVAGADIIETNTFSSTPIAQADYGMEDAVYELNRDGARLVRRAAIRAQQEDGKRRFIAGALGPTNRTASISPDVNNPGYRATSFDDLRLAYGEQLRGLIDGGSDIILVETIFDTLNAKAAIFACEEIFAEKGLWLPVMISGTITDLSGRTLSGQTPTAFWHSIRHARPFTVGLNCALGAAAMRPHLAELSSVADTFVCAYPNAGLPNAFGQYDESPDFMAGQVEESAQADAWSYRAAKLVHRHRVPVAAGMLATVALLGGSGLALWQAERAGAAARQAEAERAEAVAQGRVAREATARAERQRQVAEAAAEQARSAGEQARLAAEQAAKAAMAERRAAAEARQQGAVADAVQQFMSALFKANTARQPDPLAARATTARELLDIGAERVGTDLDDQPAVRHQIALLLSTLYSELGLEQRSLDMARQAYTAAQQSSRAGSPQQLAALSRMLEQIRLVGQPAELRAWVAQAESQLERLPPRPEPERIDLLCKLSLIYELNQPSRAWELGSQATALARRLGQSPLLQRSLGVQARAGVRLQRDAEAELLLTEALQLHARAGTPWSFDQAQLRAALAEAQSRQLRYTAAVATLREALSAAERYGGPDHMDAIQLQLRMASPLMVLGQVSQAAALLERVRDKLRSQGSERQIVLSLALSDLGFVYTELGQIASADLTLDEALKLRDRLRPQSDAAAAVRENLAYLRLSQGRRDDAERLMQEAEAVRNKLGQRPGEAAWTRWVLRRVTLARAQGRIAEAQSWVRRWHDAVGQADGKGIGAVQRALTASTLALDAADPTTAAKQLALVERALAHWRSQGPLVALEVPYRIQCGRLARQLGERSEASERHLAEAERLLDKAVQPEAPVLRELSSARQEKMVTTTAPPLTTGICPIG